MTQIPGKTCPLRLIAHMACETSILKSECEYNGCAWFNSKGNCCVLHLLGVKP